jgi:hypothetical protein
LNRERLHHVEEMVLSSSLFSAIKLPEHWFVASDHHKSNLFGAVVAEEAPPPRLDAFKD